jgi:hypothetical protein
MNPDFTGSWKANLAKSKFLASPPKGPVVQIELSIESFTFGTAGQLTVLERAA